MHDVFQFSALDVSKIVSDFMIYAKQETGTKYYLVNRNRKCVRNLNVITETDAMKGIVSAFLKYFFCTFLLIGHNQCIDEVNSYVSNAVGNRKLSNSEVETAIQAAMQNVAAGADPAEELKEVQAVQDAQ